LIKTRSLLFEEAAARRYVLQLKRAPLSEFKAKDIFRAARSFERP